MDFWNLFMAAASIAKEACIARDYGSDLKEAQGFNPPGSMAPVTLMLKYLQETPEFIPFFISQNTCYSRFYREKSVVKLLNAWLGSVQDSNFIEYDRRVRLLFSSAFDNTLAYSCVEHVKSWLLQGFFKFSYQEFIDRFLYILSGILFETSKFLLKLSADEEVKKFFHEHGRKEFGDEKKSLVGLIYSVISERKSKPGPNLFLKPKFDRFLSKICLHLPSADVVSVVTPTRQSLECVSTKGLSGKELLRSCQREDLGELPGRVVDVRGDGNCFFYALEHELRRQGLETLTYVELRARAIAHLEAHPDLLSGPIELNDKAVPRIVSKEEYLAEMQKDKAYVEGPIIFALALAFNIHLSISELRVNALGAVVGLYPIHINDDAGGRRATIGLIRQGQHYKALELADEHSLKKESSSHVPVGVAASAFTVVGISGVIRSRPPVSSSEEAIMVEGGRHRRLCPSDREAANALLGLCGPSFSGASSSVSNERTGTLELR